MAVRGFFYNSVNKDRLYNGQDMNEDKAPFYKEGVAYGHLQVTADGESMAVKVDGGSRTGYAYINLHTIHNTTVLELPVSGSSGTLPRIDRVILRNDETERKPSIFILEGAYSSNPQPPELTNNDTIQEKCLAEIYVAAGAVAISQSDITDTRADTGLCGFIASQFEDFDFSFQPTINKEQILDFKNLRFIENKENIIFVGSPGVGKTHLATSIGIVAAKNRDSTYFINCNDLISNLKKANSENRFMNRLNHYAKYKVLIIDEMGFLPIDNEGANMLFQLINKRYENHSTIITTNKPFGKWYEIFGDVTLANAILDRLLHHSHIININGNSYRLKDKLKSEIAEET